MSRIEWDKAEDGTLIIHAYEGHVTATISDDECALRLEYLDAWAGDSGDVRSFQILFSRGQARELGKHLLTMADAPHVPDPPSDLKH